MSFKHTDLDGDAIEIYKANPATPDSHYVDTSSSLGGYIPFSRTSELVASLYADMGLESTPTPVMVTDAARAERYAAAYARAAVALRQRDGRQEARDQLIRDFFSRAKGVGIDTIEDEHRREYEDTCRFFDTSPYDAPGAR